MKEDKDIAISLVTKALREFEDWAEKIYKESWYDMDDPKVKASREALRIFRKYFG